ncbi:hypothetical protein ACCS70_30165 [Rhizobium ruizarguesonis]|jgi:hypothetical protein|uniref:Uncharacterized protein n=1 Tax=Rhizobium ruizarguesonis TaxID=2081791 RepID=A0AB38I0N6_9HYPH|nr:hypothetical protein [Rhizobium ruizarguesonis]MBY5802500.1 hypothetical protein [Rhizobium leguminosarum]NKL11247.1 hypothetical protein [Rhizobium leguminosarum bv. viciae]QIO42877.1 hypothetical protein HA464_02015 [Rhizobium leguminosarum bv. trifolii]QJS28225.1 hypothetical protein RLTA1_13405 [Rhizobium leguminosarum bv. trifolii TA1]MBC2804385.1 hypothetical protein [Rhizobium ruizarguesonis]
MACHLTRRHSGHVDRLTARDSFSHETVFADLRLAAMKREREPSSKAYRQDRFENTERAAKETIEAEQRARREKTKRLKELRLSQQGAKDPAIK